MRVIFMGNPEFSIPTIKAIQNSRHDLLAIVSNPPKPIGRNRLLHLSPVGKYAREKEIPLIEAPTVNSEILKTQLADLYPDIFIVVAYKILPSSIINIPKYGSINLHASLLPKYRGAAPIQWAIMNGDKKTGITVFQIAPSVDTGSIISQKEIRIFNDDNMQTLGKRLCLNGAELIIQALKKIEKGENGIPQDSNHATRAPKIEKNMTVIDWRWPAEKIHNWIRGLTPKPGMITFLNKKRIRIYATKVLGGSHNTPGMVIDIHSDSIVVSTGKGLLAFSEIQLEGKKKLLVSEFLNGNAINIGLILGE